MAYDDFEQGERIKEGLRHNGGAVVVGLGIGCARVFGDSGMLARLVRVVAQLRGCFSCRGACRHRGNIDIHTVTKAWHTTISNRANASRSGCATTAWRLSSVS